MGIANCQSRYHLITGPRFCTSACSNFLTFKTYSKFVTIYFEGQKLGSSGFKPLDIFNLNQTPNSMFLPKSMSFDQLWVILQWSGSIWAQGSLTKKMFKKDWDCYINNVTWRCSWIDMISRDWGAIPWNIATILASINILPTLPIVKI